MMGWGVGDFLNCAWRKGRGNGGADGCMVLSPPPPPTPPAWLAGRAAGWLAVQREGLSGWLVCVALPGGQHSTAVG